MLVVLLLTEVWYEPKAQQFSYCLTENRGCKAFGGHNSGDFRAQNTATKSAIRRKMESNATKTLVYIAATTTAVASATARLLKTPRQLFA